MYIWGEGSGQTFCRQSRDGSGQRFAGSGRVQEKWPVDNSDRNELELFDLIIDLNSLYIQREEIQESLTTNSSFLYYTRLPQEDHSKNLFMNTATLRENLTTI